MAETQAIRRLICAVCGASTRGRQWWNRDTGYGICESCAVEEEARPCNADGQMRSLYGERGIHYGVNE